MFPLEFLQGNPSIYILGRIGVFFYIDVKRHQTGFLARADANANSLGD